MRRSIALALIAVVGLASPAAATRFSISYTGFAEYVPEGTPYDVVYDETGHGFLDLDTSLSEVTLGSGLSSFTFTTALTEIVSGEGFPPYVYPAGTVTYGLADLTYFDAIISGGVITSFEFATNRKNQNYGDGTSVAFDAFDGYGESDIDGGPSPSGPIALTLDETASVPDVASWALMAAGFGLVGTRMRTRRKRGGFDARSARCADGATYDRRISCSASPPAAA